MGAGSTSRAILHAAMWKPIFISQLDTCYESSVNGDDVALHTICPGLGQSDSVPPLIDGEGAAAAEIGQKEAMFFIVNVEDAGAAVQRAPVQEGDAGGVVGYTVDG